MMNQDWTFCDDDDDDDGCILEMTYQCHTSVLGRHLLVGTKEWSVQ
jgi:hypothetical protein